MKKHHKATRSLSIRLCKGLFNKEYFERNPRKSGSINLLVSDRSHLMNTFRTVKKADGRWGSDGVTRLAKRAEKKH